MRTRSCSPTRRATRSASGTDVAHAEHAYADARDASADARHAYADARHARGSGAGEADYLGLVAGETGAELGVEVDHVVAERGEGGGEQDVVEDLGVAFEVVGVALGVGQGGGEVGEAGADEGLDRRGPGEVVEVAGHHDAG